MTTAAAAVAAKAEILSQISGITKMNHHLFYVVSLPHYTITITTKCTRCAANPVSAVAARIHLRQPNYIVPIVISR